MFAQNPEKENSKNVSRNILCRTTADFALVKIKLNRV